MPCIEVIEIHRSSHKVSSPRSSFKIKGMTKRQYRRRGAVAVALNVSSGGFYILKSVARSDDMWRSQEVIYLNGPEIDEIKRRVRHSINLIADRVERYYGSRDEGVRLGDLGINSARRGVN